MTTDAYALLKQAAGALSRGDARTALTLLAKAEVLAPAMPEIHLNRAFAHRTLGNHGEAIAALDTVLQREPNHLVALLSKGALVHQVAGAKQAARIYRAALHQLPDDDARLPPALAEPVRAARSCVAAGQRRAAGPFARRHRHSSRAARRHSARPVRRKPVGVCRCRPPAPAAPAAAALHPHGGNPVLRPRAVPLAARAGGGNRRPSPAELQALLATSEADFHPYIQYPKAPRCGNGAS